MTWCCSTAAAITTGIDPTFEQWEQLAKLSVEKAGCRCLTLPYQASPVVWKKMPKACARCSRASGADCRQLLPKNFGLGGEMSVCGACTLVAANEETVDRAFSQMKSVIRANYLTHRQYRCVRVVATILSNDALRAIWGTRAERYAPGVFSACACCLLPLLPKGATATSALSQTERHVLVQRPTKEQVLRLREEFAVRRIALAA